MGIGKGVNATELSHIAGGKGNVFSADSFDQLVSAEFLDTVNTAGCKEGECFYLRLAIRASL